MSELYDRTANGQEIIADARSRRLDYREVLNLSPEDSIIYKKVGEKACIATVWLGSEKASLDFLRDSEGEVSMSLPSCDFEEQLVKNRPYTIGRRYILPMRENFNYRNVSRFHLAFRLNNKGLYVADAGSKNGVFASYLDNGTIADYECMPRIAEGAAAKKRPGSRTSCITDNKHGVFGIFAENADSDPGRSSAKLAAEIFRGNLDLDLVADAFRHQSAEDVEYWVDRQFSMMNGLVSTEKSLNKATALVARIIEQDKRKLLAFTPSEDSRVYLTNKYRTVQLTGSLRRDKSGDVSKNDDDRTVYVAELSSGDRITLTTSKVTGDYGQGLMYEDDIGNLIRHLSTPQDAAKILVNASRTLSSDGGAIVVFVN